MVGVNSSLNVWYNSPVKPSGPGLWFVGRLLIAVSISVLVINLLIFSIYSCFSLGSLYLCMNLSISSRRSILLVYSCLWWSLMIFSISVLSILTSPFSFLILLIWVLSPFFSWWVWLKIYQFCLSSQGICFYFIDLTIVIYISFISALICIIISYY